MHRFAFAVAGAPIIGGTLALALAPTLHRGVIRPLDDDVALSPYRSAVRAAAAAAAAGESSRNRSEDRPTAAGSAPGSHSDPGEND